MEHANNQGFMPEASQACPLIADIRDHACVNIAMHAVVQEATLFATEPQKGMARS